MSHAIRFHRHGGPEVLQWEKVGADGTALAAQTAPLAADAVRLRQHAVGVNFIDIYQRSGLYPQPLPSGLGLEAAGVIEAVGTAVDEFRPGDRMAYADGPLTPIGGYAEVRDIPARYLVKLPDAIGFDTAAAMLLRGLTAQYLLRRVHRVAPDDTILIHAAAGGVGLIVSQWAKALGATVIGTVGSEAKIAMAQAHGCDHVLLPPWENLAAQVRDITGGRGVDVVYDSIGKDSFMASLDCLRPLGMMASFGNASGPPAPVDVRELAKRGSLFLTRPTLFTYTARREDLLTMADELFAVVLAGQVKIEINQRYPLREAAQAHSDLAARKTTGSTVLIPEHGG